MAGVFTIPAGADFAAMLARGMAARLGAQAGADPLALAAATVYLPTRRAARGFGEIFARALGGAALLPQLRALGESEDDDFLLDQLEDADSDGEPVALPPAIGRIRRQLLLAHLIGGWKNHRGQAPSFVQAAALAAGLAGVMDDLETQGTDLQALKDLVPAALAGHWQDVSRFLSLIDTVWPDILAAEKACNPAWRQSAALHALADHIQSHPPSGMVVAAGSTGSVPATRALLKAIAGLENGAVVLPGLDLLLDEESWNNLDPGHPQYGLRQLLEALDVPRAAVRPWHDAPADTPREHLLREVLRPAPTTDAWRALADTGGHRLEQGLNGLSRLCAADPGEESLAIALALRQALETPGRTAALVTPDRGLARRVAARMRQWNIEIDDSAGRPLAHMAAGNFLCLLAEAADAQFAPVPLLALLKHPFARAGQNSAAFRARARELDRWCLRGPRPDPGLDGITRAIAGAGNAYRPPPADALAALAAWWQGIAAILKPLEDLHTRDQVPLAALAATHADVAEQLAWDETQAVCPLWAGPDGEKAAALCATLEQAATDLPPVAPSSLAPLFHALAMAVPVREGFGRHPRLSILGPLEARLQRFDLTILGGLNEGSWPRAAGADPWFSRPMRAALGLEQPERRIGQAAHDFAMLAAQPRVLLTRSAKADGAPAIASRWLQRLEQLTAGLGIGAPIDTDHADTDHAALAARLNQVPVTTRIAPPLPRPPVAARPRRLSVTEIETWLRDPYAIYARHVLRLLPLEALDQPPGPLERGTALHTVLERFVAAFPHALPADPVQELAAIVDRVFTEQAIPKAALATWRPRFLGAAPAIIAFEAERRAAILRSVLEVAGALEIPGTAGPFTLTGRADRIDLLADGSAAILDYKSGSPPSPRQVESLLSPQLPLEAAMLARGAFKGLDALTTRDLFYMGLGDEKHAKPQYVPDPMALADDVYRRLGGRIVRFDDAATPYPSRLIPFSVKADGDYDHLARVREWAASGPQDDADAP